MPFARIGLGAGCAAAAVGSLPAVLSSKLGRTVGSNALSKSQGEDVEVHSLVLSWTGSQHLCISKKDLILEVNANSGLLRMLQSQVFEVDSHVIEPQVGATASLHCALRLHLQPGWQPRAALTLEEPAEGRASLAVGGQFARALTNLNPLLAGLVSVDTKRAAPARLRSGPARDLPAVPHTTGPVDELEPAEGGMEPTEPTADAAASSSNWGATAQPAAGDVATPPTIDPAPSDGGQPPPEGPPGGPAAEEGPGGSEKRDPIFRPIRPENRAASGLTGPAAEEGPGGGSDVLIRVAAGAELPLLPADPRRALVPAATLAVNVRHLRFSPGSLGRRLCDAVERTGLRLPESVSGGAGGEVALEPIQVEVRDGQVICRRFRMTVGQSLDIISWGRFDMVLQRGDMTMAVPLSSLARYTPFRHLGTLDGKKAAERAVGVPVRYFEEPGGEQGRKVVQAQWEVLVGQLAALSAQAAAAAAGVKAGSRADRALRLAARLAAGDTASDANPANLIDLPPA